MDEIKRTILRSIMCSKYNNSIEEAGKHEEEILQQIEEIQKFLDRQKEIYEKLKEKEGKNNGLQVNPETGRVVFEEGTLIHCASEGYYEKLVNIKDKGIMSGDFIGIPEADNQETFLCADFYRADERIDSKKFFDRIGQSDSLACRGPFSEKWKHCLKLAFIINPDIELKDLLDTDMYKKENRNHVMQNMLSLLESYTDEKYGQVSAIPYGIPSSAFSGIVLGDYLLQNEQYIRTIQQLFPDCYILTHEGKVFFDPTLSTEENDTKQNECIENLQQFRTDLTELGDRAVGRFLEKAPKSTRELLDLKQQEYSKKLSSYNPKSIEEAFKVLEEKRKRVKLNRQNEPENEDNLDEETKTIFELMSKYEQDIKQIFISNNESITHITDVSPENMIGGKISRSINRANNYETERGDWVFASSNPMDGKNPYIARNPKSGMVLIDRNTYIYCSDNMQTQHDEQGQSRVILKNPNYVYKINPERFKPVVTLRRDERGKPFFEFSEEWISEEEIDISDSEQVLGVEEITDITEVIENYQVLCDVNRTGEAMKIRGCSSREEAIQKLFDSIKSGDLRYINGEANINVSQMLENFGIVNIIGKATVDIQISEKDTAKKQIKEDENMVLRQGKTGETLSLSE